MLPKEIKWTHEILMVNFYINLVNLVKFGFIYLIGFMKILTKVRSKRMRTTTSCSSNVLTGIEC